MAAIPEHLTNQHNLDQTTDILKKRIELAFNGLDEPLPEHKLHVLTRTKFAKRAQTRRPPTGLGLFAFQTNEWYIYGDIVLFTQTENLELAYEAFCNLVGKHIVFTSGVYQGQSITLKLQNKGRRQIFLYVIE